MRVPLLATVALVFTMFSGSHVFAQLECDSIGCDTCPDGFALCDDSACDAFVEGCKSDLRCDDKLDRTPSMIGDFFAGSSARFSGSSLIDRLLVVADDLDAPNPLPAAGAALSITEPGPVGIFRTSLTSIQDVQALLRAGAPLPAGALQGTIADNATLTTSLTVGQIQTLLASTPQGFDIIDLVAPPGSYDAAVNAIFVAQNGAGGTTVFNAGASGALLQGGADALTGGEDFDAYYFFDYRAALNLLLPQVSGGGVGRSKIAEGGSILPRDRVYFRYSYIDDVSYRTNGVGMSRFTPGFERTFSDGMCSLEVRAPFASRTVSDVASTGSQTFGSTDAKFGNLTLYLKTLLLASDQGALSGGLGIEIPTADGVTLSLAGTPLLDVANDAVHLQPFLGMLRYHSDKMFSHGFVQFDFGAGDNDVLVNSTGAGLSNAGAFADRDHVLVDCGFGYWLHRNQKESGLTGVIPTFEVHHTSSLGSGESASAGPFTLTAGSTSLTNFVAGTTFEFGKANQITVAYTDTLDGNQLNGGGLRLMMSHQR